MLIRALRPRTSLEQYLRGVMRMEKRVWWGRVSIRIGCMLPESCSCSCSSLVPTSQPPSSACSPSTHHTPQAHTSPVHTSPAHTSLPVDWSGNETSYWHTDLHCTQMCRRPSSALQYWSLWLMSYEVTRYTYMYDR